MEISLFGQLREAGLSLAAGVGAGVLYDVLRVLRRQLRSAFVTVLADFVFWAAAAAALLLLGLTSEAGAQRLFMTLFLFLGVALYFCTLSRLLLPALALLGRALAELVRIALFPVRFAGRTAKKIGFFSKNLFHYADKWFNINETRHFRAALRRARSTGEEVGATEIQTGKYLYEDHRGRSAYLCSGYSDLSAQPHRVGQSRRRRAGPAGGRTDRRQRRTGI